MTLGRLVVAWVFVAGWFVIATFATSFVGHKLAIPSDATRYIDIPTYVLKRRVGEAALVALLASLWFDSLGSGGWWLVFLLLGATVSSAKWFTPAPDPLAQRVLIADIALDIARYVGAGALLAWRLS